MLRHGVDALHGTLSGPATRKLCERAWAVFGDARFARLAGISNGHLYNLRASKTYQRVRGPFDKTRPVQRPIGERRKPRPEGRPGFIRVDTVHQGDLDGIKGLYHLNLVDEVTQFQCVGSVERISEAFLLPVLEALIERFPFRVLGFHADNDSEYINHRVAKLLNKLHVEEFTKSRARRSNDNALVESKNGAVVRKHFGYAHIPGRFARRIGYAWEPRPDLLPLPGTHGPQMLGDGGLGLCALVGSNHAALTFSLSRGELWLSKYCHDRQRGRPFPRCGRAVAWRHCQTGAGRCLRAELPRAVRPLPRERPFATDTLGASACWRHHRTDLLKVLRRIEARGRLETAHRAHQNCGAVFRYAVATGRAGRDPSGDLRREPWRPGSRSTTPTITDPQAVALLLRDLDGYTGSFVTACALRLLPLLFVRPGELRRAEWAEIDVARLEALNAQSGLASSIGR